MQHQNFIIYFNSISLYKIFNNYDPESKNYFLKFRQVDTATVEDQRQEGHCQRENVSPNRNYF